MNFKEFQTFYTILIHDARVFQQHIKIRLIDALVWSSVSVFSAQYILPKFGTDPKYAFFLMVGNLAIWGMLEIGTNMAIILGDIQGANALSYYLTLPISPNWIFIRMALMDAYRSIIPTILMLPAGKIILGKNICMYSIDYPKLILCWVLSHLCFGFMGLWFTSIAPSMDYITTIRQRILFPIWFLGGYQATWHMLYDVSPTFAYINLLNPVTYVMEGMRGSTNLPLQTLPYYFCILMICSFTILFGYFGIKTFKKRLNSL